MKKIIKGKRYNTLTAKKLGTNENPSKTDQDWWIETLYQKQTGEYFLHAQGGPMTKYGFRINGNSWVDGEELIPLEVSEAKEWAEKNLTNDIYKKIFGTPEDTDGKKLVTLSLSQFSINKLARMATEAQKTKSEIVDGLIRDS